MGVVVEQLDVFPAIGADRPLRFVGGMERDLGEDILVQLIGLATDERQQRTPLEPVGPGDPDDVAQRRVHIEVGDHRVDDPTTGEARRAAHEQHHPDAAIEQRRFGCGKCEAVIGRTDDQRALAQAAAVECVKHRTDALVDVSVRWP